MVTPHTIPAVMARPLVAGTTFAHLVTVGTPIVATPMPFPQDIRQHFHVRGLLEAILLL